MATISGSVIPEYSEAENVLDGLNIIIDNLKIQNDKKRDALTDISKDMIKTLSKLGYKRDIFTILGYRLDFDDTFGMCLEMLTDYKFARQVAAISQNFDQEEKKQLAKLETDQFKSMCKKAHFQLVKNKDHIAIVDEFTHVKYKDTHDMEAHMLDNIPAFNDYFEKLKNFYQFYSEKQHEKELQEKEG